MIRFIENIGDYYSQHFFSDDFPKKVFDKAGYVTQKKEVAGEKTDNHLSEINARITPLRRKYDRFKNDFLSIKREKDRIKRTHDFHKEVLEALGYINGTPEYNSPVFLNDTEVIPVRYNYSKGGKPFLFIMEMKAIVREGDKDPEGIYEQTWDKDEWEKVFPKSWGDIVLKPDVIKDALSELFLLPEDERPVYVIVLAGAKIFLIHYEKWKYDSFLLFDLEELFVESQISSNRDYLALFYALLAKSNFLGTTDSLLQSLDEDAHKAAYGVTQNLKRGVIYAVENLANEAIWYKKKNAKSIDEKDAIEKLMAEEKFARELKDECLTMVYRLLFLFYAEAREDLEILPVKDAVYQKGYSLEMLRDLEMVALTTDSSRNGDFFSKSLWKLFDYLHNGVKTSNGFEMKPLDSPLFDNEELKHLSGVQFRNIVLQQIIKRLSLSDQSKSKRIGRISYANLGINQLGSVYESLLAYSGFFAAETLIEVKADDDEEGKDGTFLVPLARRDDFREEEILKDPENPVYDKQIPKGHFVYRLNGRDRKKSASYYTPEVLTQTTVKYTLKGIIDKLKERQEKGEDCADEILSLKILEPAMGAAAFHNEVINQLADAYLELKETEEVKKSRKRIVPGQYNDELQKVKAFIAANNVYGVDLNPTAVELGKLSLWLNCMHRNMETPFFAHRLGTGNAVVGCWLKTYKEEEVIVEYPKEGTTRQRETPIPKAWWAKEPKRVKWDTKGNLTRKQNEFYHFLLPDDNMLSSANIKLIKDELSAAQKNAITQWKKEMRQPLTRDECKRLNKICTVIDALLDEHYQQIKSIIKETTSTYLVYGQQAPQMAMKGYDEKELLAESRNARSAPFYKLSLIMDYWCSLWFWDARNIADLPTRNEWYNEIENILGVELKGLNENATAKEIFENIKKYSADTSTLFGSRTRLSTVESLREQYRFFHHELEFLEVFKEKGGFDVITGNPPWVKVTFEEAEIISERYPESSIRKETAPQVAARRTPFLSVPAQKSLYLSENIALEASATFLNSAQNYILLKGQQTDLYRCIVVQSTAFLNSNGFCGLVHPDSIYDDPKGAPLRKFLYKRLKFHFQFKNEKKLFDIDHHNIYALNIYAGKNGEEDFYSIHNLFHPVTIDLSFVHDGSGFPGGIKKINDKGKFIWNTDAHLNRIVRFREPQLRLLAKTFEDSDVWDSAKLVSIHSTEIISVLEKLSSFKSVVDQFSNIITEGWHETNDIDISIKDETNLPDYDNYEVIYNGPHFFVGNPFYKTPRELCSKNHDYDIVYLTDMPEDFFPRVNYMPINLNEKFFTSVRSFDKHELWFDYFKVGMSKMISLTGERSLQPAILAPKVSHVNGVISIAFRESERLLEFTGLSSSIVLDFFVKSIGAANLTDGKLKYFPLGVAQKYLNNIFIRTLLLNCLNNKYAPLWEDNFKEEYINYQWAKKDSRLKPFNSLNNKWSWDSPLRNFYERRQALIELDVLSAMALGLSCPELILIYDIQFPVLQSYEENTYYDIKGNIVFTNNSQGLKAVGVDTKVWNEIKDMKEGDTYIHKIEKSEFYKGHKITFYAPFDRCVREDDYKEAWAHFENVLVTKNSITKNVNV